MKKTFEKTLFYLALALILIGSLFPFYWAIISSLKHSNQLFKIEYWPRELTLDNYVQIFSEQNFWVSIGNSVYVAFLTVALSLAIATLAAYSLGRVSFKGRSTLLFCILSISMFPQIAILSGMFQLVRMLGMYNQLTGLAVSYMLMILPFTIWVLTTFMRELPKELEEAAVIDGCGPLKTIFKIFLPILSPSLVTTGLLAFITAWNEFLFALTLTLTADKRTVPVSIALLSGSSQYELPWGAIMAASVIVTLPLVVLVLIFQKKIVSGLTAGAVKG